MPINQLGIPANYGAVTDPSAAGDMSQTVFGGIKAGIALSEETLKQRLEKLKLEQAIAMQQELGAVSQNPTPEALMKLSVKYPSLSEGFKRANEMLEPALQQARLNRILPVHAALNAGNTDAAVTELQTQADALRNSGKEQEAKDAENMIKVIKIDPKQFNTAAGILLAGVLGAKDYAANFVKVQEAPASVAEATAKAAKTGAEAVTAGVTAANASEFGRSEALAKLALTEEQTKHYAEDIKIRKANTQIAALNAQIARETNSLRQQQLGLQVAKATQERENAIGQRAATAKMAHTTVDNMIETLTQAIDTPMSVRRAASGPIASRVTTFDPKVSDFEELIGTIGAQTFLNQFMNMKSEKGSTGLGALSDAEGKKLETSLRSLSLRQSPERLHANLKVVRDLMTKAKKNISTKYGEPLVIPDLPPLDGGAAPVIGDY